MNQWRLRKREVNLDASTSCGRLAGRAASSNREQSKLSDRFILIGHPVGHSVSPTIHERAYELLGRSGQYRLRDCPLAEDVRACVEQIRSGELTGANVTVPWKRVAYEAADVHHSSARAVGVANVLARDTAGQVVAYNTDALALGAELTLALTQAHLRTENESAGIILGAGGAALAAAVGLGLASVPNLFVTARRFDPSQRQENWPGAEEFARLGVQMLPWPEYSPAPLRKALEKCCVLVQASSAGMRGTTGGDELPELIPWDCLPRSVAYDLVYNPPVTPFLKEAQRQGHFCRGGLGMLVGQAAQAIEIWWGESPPLAPLLLAAQAKLGL